MQRISRCRINFDAISLKFDSPVPLWSLESNINKYFEFEINGINDGSKKCYICNIEVPTSFLKEHEESKRHKINKCITVIALDRLKKQLQNRKDVEIIDNVTCDKCYCPECNTVVPLKDRKSHVNLQSHKYLASFDKMYEEFYNIYANENNDVKKSVTDKFSELNTWIPNLNDVEEICKKSEEKDKNYKYPVPRLIELDVKNNSSDVITKLNNELFCVKNEKQVTTERTLPTSKKSSVVADKDLALLKKEDENFDGNCVSVIDDISLHCKVCFSIFDVTDFNTHILSSRHKMNMISDVHYMMKKVGNELFCTICCKVLENSIQLARQHCKEANHKEKYKIILTENNIVKKKSGFYCKTCEEIIPKKNEFVHIFKLHKERQVKRMIDSDNTNCNVCDTLPNEIPKNLINVHDDSASHMTKIYNNTKLKKKITAQKEDMTSNETSKQYFCKICQVNVLNTKSKIHNNEVSHKKNLQLATNKAKNINKPDLNSPIKSNLPDDDVYFCNICQIGIINDHVSITLHNVGVSHLQKLETMTEAPKEEPKHLPDTTTVVKNFIVCKACKVQIPNNNSNLIEHGNGKMHLKNYKQILDLENIVSNGNKYLCQTCNIITGIPLKHIEDHHHKRKL